MLVEKDDATIFEEQREAMVVPIAKYLTYVTMEMKD